MLQDAKKKKKIILLTIPSCLGKCIQKGEKKSLGITVLYFFQAPAQIHKNSYYLMLNITSNSFFLCSEGVVEAPSVSS